MAFVIKDRVRENSITTGTGPLTLTGAVSGYRSFGSVCSVGDTCWYAIVHSATAWETGVGTYSGTNTLTRTTVLESSNSNSVVSFASGVKDVFIGFPSSKIAEMFDSSGASDHIRYNTSQGLTASQAAQAKSNLRFTDTPTGGFSAGDVKLTYKTTADSGWVMMNDGTIGNSLSGASNRANADTADAFAVIWAIGAAAGIVIQDSAGSASTYGANANADFIAHKRLPLPRTLGRSLAGAGAGAGLTSFVPGKHAGGETFTIGKNNVPSYDLSSADLSISGGISVNVGGGGNHQVAKTDQAGFPGASGGARIVDTPPVVAHTLDVAGTIPSGGGGEAITHRGPQSFLNVMLKL